MFAVRKGVVVAILIALACVLAAFAVTKFAGAQSTNAAAAENALCETACTAAQNNANSQNNQTLNCSPAGTTIVKCQYTGIGGIVNGQCFGVGAASRCMAISGSGLGGGSITSSLGLMALGQALGTLMSALTASQNSAASAGSAGTTCATYTQTSDASEVGINPCVYYVPSTCTDPTASNYGATGTCIYGTAAASSSADQLLQELLGSTGTSETAVNPATGASLSAAPESGDVPLPVSFSAVVSGGTGPFSIDPGDGSAPETLTLASSCAASSTCPYQMSYTYEAAGIYTAALEDGNGDVLASISIEADAAGTNTNSGQSPLQQVFSGSSSSAGLTASSTQSFSSIPGVSGNILFNSNGGTIFASTQNPGNNSAISGFYGSDTLSGGQPQGAIAGLCQNRPWASDFLSNVIPPSFFDSLCQWGGFQVGAPPPATQPQVTLQQTAPAQSVATTTIPATTPTVAPEAQIWAVPSSVTLGARTSVFWNTQGVTSCVETSPGGSFSESSLSGAAATVPLTGATTFTISCLDPNGNPITNYVVVGISS